WNPLRFGDQRYFVVFKPGYGPWPRVKADKEPVDPEALLCSGATVKLVALKSEAERRQFTAIGDVGDLLIYRPDPRILNLVRALNEEAKALGMRSYPEE